MHRRDFWLKSSGFPVLVAFLLTACVTSILSITSVKGGATYTGTAKPMEFYLHYNEMPVDFAGFHNTQKLS